ncbi:hypothetical protein GQ457_12G022510 [Hibiscus cannabinus]
MSGSQMCSHRLLEVYNTLTIKHKNKQERQTNHKTTSKLLTSKPTGVPIEPILLETTSRHGVAPVRSRDNEGKDEQDEEESNEDGHAAKVQGQQGFLVPVCTDKASKGDKEDEETKDKDRPPEKVDAAVVGLLGEPDTGC